MAFLALIIIIGLEGMHFGHFLLPRTPGGGQGGYGGVRGKIFVFDPIYKGKRAKISPKIHKIEIWPKSRPKVINSPNKSHRDNILGMFEL